MITECQELSSLSSPSDGFRSAFLPNYCGASVLRHGTPLALLQREVDLTNHSQDTSSRCTMVRAAAVAAVVALAGVTPASAQVRASIQVSVGAPVVYAVPRPVVVRRVAAPRVVVVERVAHRGHGWWKKRGYQKAIVFTDGLYYYNDWSARPGVTQVTVYTRDGRYLMELGGRYGRM